MIVGRCHAKVGLGHAVHHGIDAAQAVHPTDIDANRPLQRIDLRIGSGHTAQ
ncbi:hypothetical protein D3C78_1887690 [compost metagenome]